MTCQKHRLQVALTIFLMVVICLQATGFITVQRPDDAGRGNSRSHCCHGKVFLKLDRRIDPKPTAYLSTPSSQLIVPPSRRVYHEVFMSPRPVAGKVRPARMRGPPVV